MSRVLLLTLALFALLAVPASAAGGGGYGATTLRLDPATANVLVNQLGVTPAPLAPARAKGTEFTFPITNSLRSAVRSGTVRHSGGISLTAGGTTVELRNFDIKLLRRQLLADIPGVGNDVPILDLDYSATRLGVSWGSLRVGPVAARLTAGAATALEGAFGLAAGTIPAGLKLGDATIGYRLF
jgi:hypothetical protein